MNNTFAFKKVPIQYFIVPLLIQLLIILIVPSKSFYTYQTGKTVVIQMMPVDPYDLLRGYSQTLSYEISNLRNLQQLPEEKKIRRGDTFYLTLQAPESVTNKPPSPWSPIAISKNKPLDLPTNQIALKGFVNHDNRAKYGLETYYMPENQRQKINQEIRSLQREENGRRAFVVEIKIDRFGNSIPLSLWLENKKYRF